MILGTFNKQPSEVLDFDIDFSQWLPAGDTIDTATAEVTLGGAALLLTGTSGDTMIIDDTVVKQWVYAGTTGVTYQVQITATTVQGRVKEAEFRLRVKEI